MKKLAFLSIAFLFAMAVFQSNAQNKENGTKEKKSEMTPLKKIGGNVVSETSKTNFYTDFGNIQNVNWKRSEYFDEAKFTLNGEEITAYYDFDSKLVGTTSYKSFSDLPEEGQKAIKKNYKDYSIGQVIFFDDNEWNDNDMMLYDNQFDDADNYFVELIKGKDKIVLQVNKEGSIFFFKQLM
jgi:hypothetical protein